MNKEKILFQALKAGAKIGVAFLMARAATSEPVKSGLNSFGKKLKSNGHDVVGGAVETVKKVVGNVGNVVNSSPLVPALPGLSRKLTLDEALKTFKKGDHIAVDRKKHISHHGIYESYGRVIEYDGERIRRSTLNEFLGSSHYLYRVDSQAIYSPDRIVQRAKSRIGENQYSLISNNCEHFARWCRNGD